MSFASSSKPLDLSIGPSTRALRRLFYAHLLAVAAIVVSDPGSSAALIAGGLLAASWWGCRRHAALGFASRSLVRLTRRADGGWHGGFADGSSSELSIVQATHLPGEALLLRARREDTGKIVVRLLGNDEIDLHDLRRLRQAIISTDGVK